MPSPAVPCGHGLRSGSSRSAGQRGTGRGAGVQRDRLRPSAALRASPGLDAQWRGGPPRDAKSLVGSTGRSSSLGKTTTKPIL